MVDRTLIEQKFDAALEKVFKEKREVLRFLHQHEVRPKCLDNLCEQIGIIERRNYKITFDVNDHTKLIREIAKMFAQAALNKHEHSLISQNEKKRLETEAGKDAEALGQIQEYVNDGLIIDNGLLGLDDEQAV